AGVRPSRTPVGVRGRPLLRRARGPRPAGVSFAVRAAGAVRPAAALPGPRAVAPAHGSRDPSFGRAQCRPSPLTNHLGAEAGEKDGLVPEQACPPRKWPGSPGIRGFLQFLAFT